MPDDRPITERAPRSREAEDARRRVVTALECLERSERDALAGLESALCSYVTALRSEAMSADDITALIKTLVGTPITREGGLVVIPSVRAALVELAVGWCLAEYARLDGEEAKSPGTPAKEAARQEPPSPATPPPS